MNEERSKVRLRLDKCHAICADCEKKRNCVSKGFQKTCPNGRDILQLGKRDIELFKIERKQRIKKIKVIEEIQEIEEVEEHEELKLKEWANIARENGISKSWFYAQVRIYGVDPKEAATKKQKIDEEYQKFKKIARENGITANTFRHRVKKLGLTPEEAANYSLNYKSRWGFKNDRIGTNRE